MFLLEKNAVLKWKKNKKKKHSNNVFKTESEDKLKISIGVFFLACGLLECSSFVSAGQLDNRKT